jgi:hypothetical protein
MTSHLDVSTDATIERLQRQDEADELQRVRHREWWLMHTEDGLSHREISRVQTEALRARGLSERDIRRAGVSHDSVTLALSRLRP